jgi:signal transduction histidine kinase
MVSQLAAAREREIVDQAVADSGTGIDPKSMDRIFDAFFTTKSHGMGMGLSICRSIVKAHGGQLSASSADLHGSVFEVVFPAAKLGDDEDGAGHIPIGLRVDDRQ